jgi:hypothetical protein
VRTSKTLAFLAAGLASERSIAPVWSESWEILRFRRKVRQKPVQQQTVEVHLPQEACGRSIQWDTHLSGDYYQGRTSEIAITPMVEGRPKCRNIQKAENRPDGYQDCNHVEEHQPLMKQRGNPIEGHSRAARSVLRSRGLIG